MTTYAKDFSDELTTAVFASDFTTRYATMTDWTIEAPTDAEDDRAFQSDGTGSGVQMASWDDIDGDANRANSEIVCRFRNSTDQNRRCSLWLRASGSSGSETGYYMAMNSASTLVIGRYDAGSFTNIDSAYSTGANHSPWQHYTSDVDPAFSAIPAGVFVYFRFRVNGTGATVTLQGKAWVDGLQGLKEPAYWACDGTDTSGSRITTAGWTGVGANAHAGTLDIDYFAVGTNGDTAPINASTNTSVRLTRIWAEVAGKATNPSVQLTSIQTEVLGQADNPTARVSQSYVQVLHETNAPASVDLSGQLLVQT